MESGFGTRAPAISSFKKIIIFLGVKNYENMDIVNDLTYKHAIFIRKFLVLWSTQK
jgi:hypothetical protein